MKYTDCLGVIELADRLVLPRLVSLVEKAVIEQMTEVSGGGGDLLWEALRLVQPCQVHNATQLSGWCLSYLAHNYNTVARRFPKVLRGLLPENQATLNLNRWPPIWYLKDYDLYQRMQTEHNKSEKQTNLKRARSVCIVSCRNKTNGASLGTRPAVSASPTSPGRDQARREDSITPSQGAVTPPTAKYCYV